MIETEEKSPEEAGFASEGKPDAPAQLVHRLVRTNNLMVFLVVCTALMCLAFAQSASFLHIPRAWGAPLLTWLRIGLPVAALVFTAVFTQRALSAHLRGLGGRPVTVDSIAPTFYRCKQVSMGLLFAAALLAAACLLLGHRVADILLVVLPLGLLLIARPSMAGLLSLTQAAVQMAEEAGQAGDPSSK